MYLEVLAIVLLSCTAVSWLAHGKGTECSWISLQTQLADPKLYHLHSIVFVLMVLLCSFALSAVLL